MNHLRAAVLIVVLLLCHPWPAPAEEKGSIPHFFNFQSVLFNDNGSLVTDPFVDLAFSIEDQDGKVLYTETQSQIQVIRGAVNVLIGEGINPQATIGLPMEAMDPATGPKFLTVKIGANQAQDRIELVTVPYAMWAEKALGVAKDSITGEEIKDGTIELKDLSRSIQFSDIQGVATEAQIPTTFATDTELANHVNATGAHFAKQIKVSGPFLASPVTNVEDVLKALDEKVFLNMKNAKEDVTTTTANLTTSLGQEISDRKAADSTETTTRSQADTTLQTNLTTEANTRATADTTLQTNIDTHTGATTAHGSDGTVVGLNTLNNAINVHAALKTGVHGLTSPDPANAIVGTTETQTLSNKTLQSPVINNPTINGGTFSGTLADNTITSSKIVDGSITNADISPTAGIVDTKLATISTAGKVADSALSANVTKLGNSIESGEITDGTITNADIAGNAAISWSKVSKSGAVPSDIGAAAASHTHVDADIPNDITINFAATAGSLSSNGGNCPSGQFAAGVDAAGNAEGCASTSVDTSGLVKKSGDTMTGGLTVPSLQVNGNIGVTGTVDGVDVSNLNTLVNSINNTVSGPTNSHETRITKLEGADVPFTKVTGQISTTQVPQFMRPFAFGVVTSGGVAGSGYNLSSSSGSCFGNGGCCNVTFTTAAPNTNYTATATTDSGRYVYINNKTTAGFDFCTVLIAGQSNPSQVNFIIFGNF